jgi:hypothetical protein
MNDDEWFDGAGYLLEEAEEQQSVNKPSTGCNGIINGIVISMFLWLLVIIIWQIVVRYP